MLALAGPWVGEFGWELFGWQASLRALSKDMKIVVSCAYGNEALYEDFAEDIIPVHLKDGETSFWKRVGYEHGDMSQFMKYHGADRYLDPMEVCKATTSGKIQPKFIKFGTKSDDLSYDIVFHARSTNKHKSGKRNWPLENWRKLAERMSGKKILSIGTVESAYHIDGTDDMRGANLGILTNILSSSKVVLGPSSGPMHLSSLCGTPHVVWTDNKTGWAMKNRIRYETAWNPLKTKVCVLDEDNWQPSVDLVMSSLDGLIKD